MQRGATVFLRAVIVLIGSIALVLLLWEPHFEGRNAHATPFQIYFNDPFLAYAYIASIPFFVGLYQAFKVLGLVGRGEVFSPTGVQAVRTIRYCALAIIGFVAAGVAYIMFGIKSDDRAGGVAVGVLIMFLSVIVATAMAVLERTLQNAVDLKSENDLTV